MNNLLKSKVTQTSAIPVNSIGYKDHCEPGINELAGELQQENYADNK